MKILSPLTRIDEIIPLIEAGANQFYCGIVDTESLNDRPNTKTFNFESIQDFEKAAKICNENDVEIFLAINTPIIRIEKGLEYADIAKKSNAAGVIIANELLIKEVKRRYPDLKIYASCITGALNSQALNFLNNLGATGIHMPRHIGLDELEVLKKKCPKMEISVFGYEGMCINIECFCSLHDLKDRYFVPCDFFKTKKILTHKTENSISREEINKKIKSPKFSCSLCALKRLKEIGIDVIKIEGRDLNKERKIKQVNIMKEGLNGIGSSKYVENCKKIFKAYNKEECKEVYCYY